MTSICDLSVVQRHLDKEYLGTFWRIDAANQSETETLSTRFFLVDDRVERVWRELRARPTWQSAKINVIATGVVVAAFATVFIATSHRWHL